MATNKWNAAGAGNWSTAGNWSLGHVPLPGEDVVLDNTSVFACTLDVSSAFSLASFTIADNYTGTFTMSGFCNVYSTGSVYFGTGCTVVAAAWSVVYYSGAAAKSLTTNGAVLAALTHAAGAGALTLQDALTMTGLLNVAAEFAQNGKAIQCGSVSSRTATATYDAALTVAGHVTFGIAAPVSFPTTLTMTATGNLSVVAGGVLNAVVVNAPAGTVTLSTALSCASLTVTAGNFTSANKAITCSADIILGGGTLNLGTSTVTSTGNAATLRISAAIRTTANSTFFHTGLAATLDLANAGATTLAVLDLQAASTYTWTSTANVLTVTTVVGADWSNQTWVAGTPGNAYHIDPSGALVVLGMNVTDCHNVNAANIDATAAGNVDGGGNDRWDFPVAGGAPSRSRMSVGVGVGL